jgi:hypothetical protein
MCLLKAKHVNYRRDRWTERPGQEALVEVEAGGFPQLFPRIRTRGDRVNRSWHLDTFAILTREGLLVARLLIARAGLPRDKGLALGLAGPVSGEATPRGGSLRMQLKFSLFRIRM